MTRSHRARSHRARASKHQLEYTPRTAHHHILISPDAESLYARVSSALDCGYAAHGGAPSRRRPGPSTSREN